MAFQREGSWMTLYLSWTILLLACVCCNTSATVKGHTSGGNPSHLLQGIIQNLHYSFNNKLLNSPSKSTTPSKSSYGSTTAELAQMVFRHADLTDSVYSNIVDNTQEDVQRTIFDKILRNVDQEMLTKAFKLWLQMKSDDQKQLQFSPKSSDGPTPEALANAHWNNTCYRGLSAVFEPITDVLLNLIYLIDLLVDANLELDGNCVIDRDRAAGEIRTVCYREPFLGDDGKSIPDWGLAMLDAFGKIPAALEDGNIHWVGGYELCKSQRVSYNDNVTMLYGQLDFQGEYCRVDVYPKPAENETATTLSLTVGMCVPSTCTEDEVRQFFFNASAGEGSTRLFPYIMDTLGLNFRDAFCGHRGLSIGSDRTSLAATIVLGIFVLLLLVSSIYDGLLRPKWLRQRLDANPPLDPSVYSNFEPETPPPSYEMTVLPNPNLRPSLKTQASSSSTSGLVANDYNNDTLKRTKYWQQSPSICDRIDLFFVAFSVTSNLKKLYSIKPEDDKRLRVIDAVKFLSIGYLILGQTYLLGPVVSFVLVVPNTISMLRTLLKQWNFMPVLGFHHATDSFFLCSGLLMTLFWFRKIQKYPKDEVFGCAALMRALWFVLKIVLHLYWRLMPSMMMVMMIFVVYYRYLAAGPLASRTIPFADNCIPNWWTNILMVQNLVNLDKQCMAWTWYFSAIFQLHLVAIVLLVLYHFSPFMSFIGMAAVYAAHIAGTAVQSQDLISNKGGLIGSFRTWNNYYYITPWAHAGPYIMGMILAFILRHFKFRCNINKFLCLLAWLAAIALITFITYIPYDMYKELDITRWSLSTMVTYDTLSRTGWSLGVGWIVFACATDNGGFIGDVLSWKAFQPLGKMTYSVYILHAIAILRYMYNRMSLLYVAENEMVYLYFGNLVMSHIYGLLCCMLFEYPFRGIERMISCQTKFDAMMAGSHPDPFGESDKNNRANQYRHTNGTSNSIVMATKL